MFAFPIATTICNLIDSVQSENHANLVAIYIYVVIYDRPVILRTNIYFLFRSLAHEQN